MSIGKTIVKRIIIILEGCVCKLKEWYPDASETEISLGDKYVESDTSNRKSENQTISEEFFNISLLDGYFSENNISPKVGFVKLLQKIELNTELNVVQMLIDNLESTDNIIAVFDSEDRKDMIKFIHHSPSPIRMDEERTVSKAIIEEELKECDSTDRDLSCNLYNKALVVIEVRQQNVVNSVFKRFWPMAERIKQCRNEEELTAHKKVLLDALTDRKEILDSKMVRFVC